jgi:excisionase family DNA binding protein
MKLLTPKEAAAQAKVSKSLIYTWCDERRLPHIRAGKLGKRGRILIKEDDLDTFMQGLKVERHPLLAAFE